MTAVGAVGDTGGLVKCIVALLLCNPSPRVLYTVSKEDVSLSDVPATLINCGLLGLWHSGHTFTEGTCAHSRPVGLDKHG